AALIVSNASAYRCHYGVRKCMATAEFKAALAVDDELYAFARRYWTMLEWPVFIDSMKRLFQLLVYMRDFEASAFMYKRTLIRGLPTASGSANVVSESKDNLAIWLYICAHHF